MRTNYKAIANAIRQAGGSDTAVLGALRRFSERRFNVDQLVNEREYLQHQIDALKVDGMIFVRCWYRDCDCAERTYLAVIPATLAAYQSRALNEERDAEGPWSMTIIDRDEAREFKSSSRDRVMEAFENGETYRV